MLLYYLITFITLSFVHITCIVSQSVDPDKFYLNPEDIVANLADEMITLKCRLKPFESDNREFSQMGKVGYIYLII